jgi:methylated-DNA-[protein]-cysteine S-methyltransferase
VTKLCNAAIPETPLGPLWVAATSRGLATVGFHDDQSAVYTELKRRYPTAILTRLEMVPSDQSLPSEALYAQAAAVQLVEYLKGQRQYFDFPIDWSGMTDFQERVLRLTLAIPYGETRTYGGIARQIGRPKSARAVGRAQATNPMPLVIPCHRVLGSDGGLHGYGGCGGLATKAWLLELESQQYARYVSKSV